MRGRALILAGALACGVGAWSAPAQAVMDPAHAQADVDAAMRAHAYSFCRAPHEPLSPDAVELCPHASAIPDCAGYATACAKMTTPPSWSLPSWWGIFSLPSFLGVIFQVLMWLVVAALVLAILVPVVAAIVRYRRRDDARAKKADKPSVAAAAEPLAELVATSDEEALLARADELAAHGEYAAALQLYLAASLRALDKRGAVRITRDRTNGEYVRSCADAASKPALRDIVREVDRVQFGGEPASREAASRAAQRAVAIVKAVPLALLVILLPLVLGCSGAASFKPRVPGDDPAGGELLRDVLRAQGATVKGLDSSLATMPIPAAGERTPAVIVDVEQTSLDDDTRAHLARWVEAGGILVLAGSPGQWPKEFGASNAWATGPRKITARRLLARAVAPEEDEDEADEDSDSTIYARTEEHGVLATDRGLKFKGASEDIAWYDDHTTYAAAIAYGKGRVLCIGSDELLTNAGIAHPGNSAALVAILAATSRSDIRIADPEDGVSPPSTPIAALLRAGLGMGLLHAVPFIVVLFLGAGTRLSRPKPAPPPRRRAFAEHVSAVGALYARTHNGAHALASYARFADERLRARMPRGSMDVGGFLASRAGMPLDVCQRLWARAMQAKAGAPPLGDELSVLRELSVVYAAAMQQER